MHASIYCASHLRKYIEQIFICVQVICAVKITVQFFDTCSSKFLYDLRKHTLSRMTAIIAREKIKVEKEVNTKIECSQGHKVITQCKGAPYLLRINKVTTQRLYLLINV